MFVCRAAAGGGLLDLPDDISHWSDQTGLVVLVSKS